LGKLGDGIFGILDTVAARRRELALGTITFTRSIFLNEAEMAGKVNV
jgi:hypothetical protein